jgi:hypothetical protein
VEHMEEPEGAAEEPNLDRTDTKVHWTVPRLSILDYGVPSCYLSRRIPYVRFPCTRPRSILDIHILYLMKLPHLNLLHLSA